MPAVSAHVGLVVRILFVLSLLITLVVPFSAQMAPSASAAASLHYLFGSGSATGGRTVTFRIELTEAAPRGGAVVQLATSDPAIPVPSTITIAAGQTEHSFRVTTVPVSLDTNVLVSATSNGVTRSRTVLIKAPVLSNLSVQSRIRAGGQGKITVRLSGPAPAGGIVVNLNSNRPSVIDSPGDVTIEVGEAGITLIVDAAFRTTNDVPINITARYNGAKITRSTIVRYYPEPVTPTATSTPTETATSTATETATSTATASETATATAASTDVPPTLTSTNTASPTATETATATASHTGTATTTPTDIPPTATESATSTATSTPTASATPSPTGTDTATALPTDTPSATASSTATAVPADTATDTATTVPTDTATVTPSVTATDLPTSTATDTVTSTWTATATQTITATPTASPSLTPTATESSTLVPTETETASATATADPTDTSTPTYTPTRTETPTSTSSPTPTETQTDTPTATSSPTATTAPSQTATPSATPSPTQESLTGVSLSLAPDPIYRTLKPDAIFQLAQPLGLPRDVVVGTLEGPLLNTITLPAGVLTHTASLAEFPSTVGTHRVYMWDATVSPRLESNALLSVQVRISTAYVDPVGSTTVDAGSTVPIKACLTEPLSSNSTINLTLLNTEIASLPGGESATVTIDAGQTCSSPVNLVGTGLTGTITVSTVYQPGTAAISGNSSVFTFRTAPTATPSPTVDATGTANAIATSTAAAMLTAEASATSFAATATASADPNPAIAYSIADASLAVGESTTVQICNTSGWTGTAYLMISLTNTGFGTHEQTVIAWTPPAPTAQALTFEAAPGNCFNLAVQGVAPGTGYIQIEIVPPSGATLVFFSAPIQVTASG